MKFCRKSIWKVLSFVLILCFCLGHSIEVSATENGQMTREELKEALLKYNAEKKKTIDNEEDLIKYAYKQFSNRQGIVVIYSGALNNKDYKHLENEDLDVLLRKVIESHCDGTDIEGITLWGNTENYNKGLLKEDGYTIICMSLNYRNSKDEMDALEQFYETTYRELDKKHGLSKADDFHKVKIVHDFICENFEFDESLSNYDDYKGVVRNKDGKRLMVCQGYSLMCAKLLNMAGVECRIVLSSDKSHSWNIVKMGDKWYHLDATHDDTGYFNGTYDYKYFLRPYYSGEGTYTIAKSCYLYSSLDDITFASSSYDSTLWNPLGINKHVYEFFFRTLHTNQQILTVLFFLFCLSICIYILSYIRKHFIKKKRKQDRDYYLYNQK